MEGLSGQAMLENVTNVGGEAVIKRKVKKSGCDRVTYMIKQLTIFKLKHGIFHEGRVSYVSKVSMCATLIILILTLGITFHNFSKLGLIQDISSYAISEDVIGKLKLIPPNDVHFQNLKEPLHNSHKYKNPYIGKFPLIVWIIGYTCEELEIYMSFDI